MKILKNKIVKYLDLKLIERIKLNKDLNNIGYPDTISFLWIIYIIFRYKN